MSVVGTCAASSLSRQHVPALGLDFDDAVVDQHLDQFFHVERVAFGAVGDQRAQRRRDVVEALQQRLGELLADLLVERLQVEPLVRDVLASTQSACCSNTVGRVMISVSSGMSRFASQQTAHERERLRVGPVQVVEHHHHRPRLAEAAQAQRAGVEGQRP